MVTPEKVERATKQENTENTFEYKDILIIPKSIRSK
jgi:hypothetical protein